VVCPDGGKAHQEERRPAFPIREKVQEGEKRLRRIEEEKVVCLVKGEVQQEWRRSLIEELRKRAEEHCRKGIPEEAQFLELGWYVLGMIVIYTECRGCGRKGSYAEDNRGQGVLWDRTFWYRCRGKKRESSAPTERKNAAREEKAARPREVKA